uniref:Uncharacterized protein n=1 Tax=Phytophthora fragariae TaxID=53985 RepID=A0A6A3E6D5_9STRA|nr:hypothetical protein PF009_g24373 [Phytophthora fragariae]
MRTTSGVDVTDGKPGGEMNEVEGCVATTGSEVDITSASEDGLVAASMGGGEITAADTDGSFVEVVSMDVTVVGGAFVVAPVLVEALDAIASSAGMVTRPPHRRGSVLRGVSTRALLAVTTGACWWPAAPHE